MANQRVVDVLVSRLQSWGVERVYGEPLGTLTHVPVQDGDLAVLLADADGRIGDRNGHGRVGAAFLQDRILHLSSQPGGTSTVFSVETPDDLIAALHKPTGIDVPATMALHLDIDLEAPLDADVGAAWQPEQRPVVTLNESIAGLRVMMIVGPGVVRAGSVDQLQQCVRQGGFGVLNTFGAKGVERWDSPYFLGTAGLQAEDWKRAGCFDVDVILTSGIDAAELPPAVLSRSVVQDVPSTQLQALTRSWPNQGSPQDTAPLVSAVNSIVHPLVESDESPMNPARASLHLSGALPAGGVVVSDPGRAGWWIARTLPTGIPGSSVVPALDVQGFAAAAALVCSLESRPYVAVTDHSGPNGDNNKNITARIAELAESLQAPISLQQWIDHSTYDEADLDAGTPITHADDHVALLQQLTQHANAGTAAAGDPRSNGQRTSNSFHSVIIDYSAESELIDTLGQPVPWTF